MKTRVISKQNLTLGLLLISVTTAAQTAPKVKAVTRVQVKEESPLSLELPPMATKPLPTLPALSLGKPKPVVTLSKKELPKIPFSKVKSAEIPGIKMRVEPVREISVETSEVTNDPKKSWSSLLTTFI